MSTLSPLGRYGGRGRRRLRTGLVLLFAVGALVVAGVIGWSAMHQSDKTAGPGPSTASTPNNSCSPSATSSSSKSGSRTSTSKSAKPHSSRSASPTTASKLPKPKSITLNVYNSTTRNGLARKTANLLANRGFTIGSVKNDPSTTAVKGPAEVRYGAKGVLAARVVAAEVRGATLVEDKRSSADVDIALGAAFQHLASPAQVKAALSPKASPSSSC
jgi:hypothetical protein